MPNDRVLYLNHSDDGPMVSKLRRALIETKQGRASAGQWAAMIAALTQKGVKKLEIEEVGIDTWLSGQDPALVLTKDELLAQMLRMTTTVKEVVLATPLFSSYRQPGGTYQEFLYIANSERGNMEDELSLVEYEMEELSMHIDRLEENPDLLNQLEDRRTALLDLRPKAIDFPQHHFSRVVNGKHGRNLLAHCRVIEYADTYFIQEIQSDWAQQGRKSNWVGVPEGPFVTNSEAWSGMVLRRHMQLAAQNPLMKRIAWMTESMRNGSTQDSLKERQDEENARARSAMVKEVSIQYANQLIMPGMSVEQVNLVRDGGRIKGEQAADAAGLRREEGMNDFYLKMLPKLADKAVAGTGGKIEIQRLNFDNERPAVEVPTMDLTDAVRAKLVEQQPLYSRAPRVAQVRSELDPEVTALVRRCGGMIGSPKHLRLVRRLYDTATGKAVAGSYVNRFVQIALDAKDIDEVADHESFHFAEENLLAQHERDMLSKAFAFGSELHVRVQEVLVGRSEYELALHCHDPREAAAQGFALWRKGLLDVAPVQVTGIFRDIVTAVRDVFSWLKAEVLDQKLQTPEDVFKAFDTGALAERRSAEIRRYQRVGMGSFG